MRTLRHIPPGHNLILLPCDTKWDFCVWAATEGHMKRWGLYNRWCQIGCQLQHKWRSISSVPHGKRPLYRRLDFRRHKKSLLPAHSTALQEGLQNMHTEACIHAYIHKASRYTHGVHPYRCQHSYTCRDRETFWKHTHTRWFALHPTHNSFFRKHITDRALGLLQALAHTHIGTNARSHIYIFSASA